MGWANWGSIHGSSKTFLFTSSGRLDMGAYTAASMCTVGPSVIVKLATNLHVVPWL
jgi:hypothetical protein